MNRLLLLLSFLGLFSTLSAQSFTVKGEIVAASDNSPLIGAYVFLSQEGKEPSHQTATDYDGNFVFDGVPAGQYDLKVDYLGFQTLERSVTVAAQDLLLGKLTLKAGIDLSEVEVVEKVVPVTQNGDTTSLNAAAYKTLSDASAEDLIEKMPTITITDGKVQAQGEDVKRVLVDGKPFFGDDPTATLKNIPAEIIQRIEIFDQQSDQAAFTGFDDGEESKTINIVTKTTMRNGTFGQIYGGYGTDDRYEAGMSINNFSGDRRISIVGLSNNVNRQNFSSEDLLGVTSSKSGGGRGGRGGGGRGGAGGGSSASNFLVNDQSGIVTSNAFGLNYSDQWGEDLTVSGSYFFNRSNSDTDQDLTRQFFDAEGLQERYSEASLINNINTNHRFNGRLEWKANDNNSFIWQPRLSWQNNDGEESTLGNTFLGSELLNATNNQYSAQLQALQVDNNLLWRHKFEKARRTLSVNLSGGFNPSTGTSELLFSEQMESDSTAVVSADQMATLDHQSLSGSVRLQYTEPVGKSTMLTVRSTTNIQREDSEQLTFLKEENTDTYDLLDESLSGIAVNDYLSQDIGLGVNYRYNSFNFTAQAALQYANLMTESQLPAEPVAGKTFWNVLPSLSLRLRPSKTENFSFSYRSSTDLPDISELQEVVRNDDPLFLTVGNADLTQATEHRLFARYNLTKPESSSVFFALLGGTFTNNAISNSTFLSGDSFDGDYEVPVGAQISQSVNLDNNWNLRALATYGFPLKLLSSNLNTDVSFNYSNVPGLINGELNVAKTTTAGLGLTLASNISDRLDFTVSSRTSMNWATNDLQAASNDNYLNQQSRLKFAWVVGPGLVFRTDLTHQLYRGLDETFDQDFLLWNLSIGKKVFAGDRGEISIGAFDLLNQNVSLTRNITETYSEDIRTNALGQYVKLSFKYDLRSFK